MNSELIGIRLSPSEAKFIKDGIHQGIRKDGRGLLDSRHLFISFSVIPQANGSARIRNHFSLTDVLCGVRVEVGSVNDPSVTCTVEMGALARSDLFGPVEASKRAEARGQELADLLATWLTKYLELPPLLPGKAKWLTTVECIVLGDGGNILDSLFLACFAALHDARIPAVKINADATDFEIDPDFDSAKSLELDDMPLPATCWLVSDRCLCDPSSEEEVCTDSAINVEFNKKGEVLTVRKLGNTGIDANLLLKSIMVAKTASKHMRGLVEAEIKAAGNIGDSGIVSGQTSWSDIVASTRTQTM